ncbi:MAG: peptide deformylase [Chloroflexi bacterium]|nr:peptide deformylase [Chloroflexota bacterium]
MALREIVLVPDPVLRRKAKKVAKVTPAIQRLLDDMAETMRAAPGVWLAGPQIGVLQRVIVVEVQPDPDKPDTQHEFYQLVNPEIAKTSQETEEGSEGCLSIPGYVGDVVRAVAVDVKALDRSGKPIKIKARGFLARVLQHEIDHLDGILYLDRLAGPDKLHQLPEDDAIPEETKVVA